VRYIIVSEEFPPKDGGVAGFAAGLTRALHAVRPDTVLLARRDAGQVPLRALPGVTAWPLTGWRWKQLRHLHMLRHGRRIRLLAREAGEAVLLFLSWKLALAPLLLLRDEPSVRTAVFAHGADVLYPTSESKLAMLRRAFNGSDLGIGVSRWLARQIESRGVPASRLAALHPGVDAAPFARDDGEVRRLRERLELEGRGVLLTVARLDFGKGHEELLRALPAVLERHPRTLWLVAGDGPRREFLERLAEKLGVSGSIRFLGAVTPGSAELAALYHASDVFAMPNVPYRTRRGAEAEEAAGIVFLEAGVCGKPVIAGDSGGAPELVVEGETGFVVDGRATPRLADAINRLLDEPALAREMGQRGRRKALEEHSWAAVVARLIALVES
jgi:phosphatidylinositol alpha-1,6-mannosyltransferase